MKQAAKLIITVLVSIFCSFVCLISVGIYLSKTDYLEYEAEGKTDPEISNTLLTCLGDSYAGEEREGCSYYRLEIEVENNSNFGKEIYSLIFRYEAQSPEGSYSIREIQGNGFFRYWENSDYLPAGKTATIVKVICVENECEEFDLIYSNHSTKNEQRVHLKL